MFPDLRGAFQPAAVVGTIVPLVFRLAQFALFPAAAFNSLDYGQYYGYLADASLVGAAALNPHDPYFARMRPDAIKAPHGHFQHLAPADPGDDFPYSEFKDYEAAEIAAGRAPLLVTASYAGKPRPVFFEWSLQLDDSHRPTAPREHWAQAVDLRDDRYIRFFIDKYVRGRLWHPEYPNYWVMVDNCSFRYGLYGVLDDNGVYHSGVPWDHPFASTGREFLDSIVYFLHRVKQLAPDLRIMGNEGSLDDEADYPRIWAGFDGSVREDINAGFQTDAYSRGQVYTFYRRYRYLAAAGKLAILRALLPHPDAPDFEQKLRTSYVTYLLFRGANFYYGPRLDDGTARGIDPSTYASMRDRFGVPIGPAREDRRLYSRECEGGMVFLNYSGAPRKIPLPGGYCDRDGIPAASITIPDMRGDYVLSNREPRAARPLLSPIPAGSISGPLHLSVSGPPGASLHCTQDGSEPHSGSPVCDAVFEIRKSTRLRARSFAPDMLPSFTASADIRIEHAAPQASFCAPPGDYVLVCLNRPAGNPVMVKWTLEGSAPEEIVFEPGERYRYIRAPQPGTESGKLSVTFSPDRQER